MFNLLEDCEKIIGYSFKNKDYLSIAFTHASYSNEHKGVENNERLEFLGDSVLGFVISDYLFNNFPDEREGVLTLKKQGLVSKTPLSNVIIKNGLDKYLRLGQGGKAQFENNKISSCENVFEAIVAAIYLDGGLDCAKKFIYDKLIDGENSLDLRIDYKSQLLYFAQAKRLGDISYKEIEKNGPAHRPSFTMGVYIDNNLIATGEGSAHKRAEQQAAKLALQNLKSEEL